jgi:hypothetical protein
MSMAGRLDEANLAWELASAAKPHLGADDRDRIFVAIGAGETFEAMRMLIKFLAVKRIPVTLDMALECNAWERGYVGHQDSWSLRRYIGHFVLEDTVRAAATAPLDFPRPRPTRRRRELARRRQAAETQIRQLATARTTPLVASRAKSPA